jgi:RNA polymerase sigma-70 factor (ECF subfamily)
LDRLESDAEDALDQLLEYERGELLAAAMSRLPLIHREVLSLRFEEEMKLDQIAEVIGVPLSTVKSRLFRSLENLRVMLEPGFRGRRKE